MERGSKEKFGFLTEMAAENVGAATTRRNEHVGTRLRIGEWLPVHKSLVSIEERCDAHVCLKTAKGCNGV